MLGQPCLVLWRQGPLPSGKIEPIRDDVIAKSKKYSEAGKEREIESEGGEGKTECDDAVIRSTGDDSATPALELACQHCCVSFFWANVISSMRTSCNPSG